MSIQNDEFEVAIAWSMMTEVDERNMALLYYRESSKSGVNLGITMACFSTQGRTNALTT